MAASNEPFYVRYYSGHSGRFGHEFLEFDFRTLGDGRSASARYANNSNYRNDSLIRKEMCVSSLLISEIKKIVRDSEIMKEDDAKWPEKNKDGRQELEIRLGNEHISFETAKIGSLVEITESADPEGLRVFYYLVQDLKALVFSLISLHFKVFSISTFTVAFPPHITSRLILCGPMPTPSDSTDELLLPSQIEHSLHSSCPPEIDRPAEWRAQVLDRLSRAGYQPDAAATAVAVSRGDENSPQPQTLHTNSNQSAADQEADIDRSDRVATTDVDAIPSTTVSDSPASCQAEEKQIEEKEEEQAPMNNSTSSIVDLPYSTRLGLHSSRLIQTYTSSMLRPGSKFRGTQQSDASRYSVEVDIKTVDMSESSICGYLKIDGLTPEHATLTTCFEGEIIGPKYTFQTRHEDWGATDKDDLKAWARFPAWRAFNKQAKKSPDFHYKNSSNRENMFMRWKEKFLVPDHRVREITGASFEGFYYICFNQIHGTITGIYYHSKTDNSNNKIQQLELKWVPDRGCLAATEFR